MKPYSKDLRLRVLAAVDRGMPREEVAETFGVSKPTIRRYLRLRRETGVVDPKPPSGPPARKGRALEAALPSQVSRNPDLTLEEHRELFYDEHGTEVSRATISRGHFLVGAFEASQVRRFSSALPGIHEVGFSGVAMGAVVH